MADPTITHLTQVSVISRDLQATIKAYVEDVGIGPWAVIDLSGPELTNVELHGQPAQMSARIAIAWTDGIMWEVVQPIAGPSIYQEFLDANGEGMHHVMVRHSAADYDAFIDSMKAKGYCVSMSMKFRGARFAYLDATSRLKLTIEVVERPAGAAARPNRPAFEPSYWYPARPVD